MHISQPNTIIFRVDGYSNIGIGHLMRCVALADGLSRKGFRIIFCIKPIDRILIDEILKSNFTISEIPVGLTLEEDAEWVISEIEKYKARIVVLDGYHFDNNYFYSIKQKTFFLVCIDDLAENFQYSDLIINQNIYAIEAMYSTNIFKPARLLLGPKYALLRLEFKELHDSARTFKKVSNILITFGGSDSENQTLKTLKALEGIKGNFNIAVVLGVSNHNVNSISDYVSLSKKNIKIINNSKDMHNLMLKADIAISGGGVTTWELCCLGLPMLQIILASNQEEIVNELERKGASVKLGWYKDVFENDIRVAILDLIGDVDRRRAMSCCSRSIVDGKGVERVAEDICMSLKNN